MTDRPIIFSTPMVRALLEGRKTQTRRIIKPAPFIDHMGNFYASDRKGKVWNWGQHADGRPCIRNFIKAYCPFGQLGDRLWVREAFAHYYELDEDDTPVSERMFCFRADGYPLEGYRRPDNEEVRDAPPWKPSIHMPRSMSRLTLVLTDIRAQRLQDISEEDAAAKGAEVMVMDDDGKFYPSSDGRRTTGFAGIWSHINGTNSWDVNPWVWALTFTVHRGNIDALPAQQVAA